MSDADDQDIKAISAQVAHKLKRAIDRRTGAHLTTDEVRFLGNSALREWIENVCAGTAI